MSVLLDPAIKSETVQIEYMLVGTFGGYGGFVRSRSGLSVYDIPIVVDSARAEDIKFFIWAPGCRMAAFDISLLGAAAVQRTYACVPSGTTTLAGMVPKELVTSSSEITVAYVAHWSCDFFGLKDCMVPTMSLGTIRPDADGVFRIELPDFSDDPVASQSAGGAEFLVQFRDANTMPLQPENLDFRTATHGLKIAHKYPANLQFLALSPEIPR